MTSNGNGKDDTGKVFDPDAFLRAQEARLREQEKQKVLERQRNQDAEDDNIVVTKHGAFRKKPAELSPVNDPGKPQIFKMTLNRVTQKVTVTNKEGTWTGELQAEREQLEFFGNRVERYVVGMANASGKLHIEYGIEPGDEHKF